MQDIPDDIIIQAAQGDLPSFEVIYKAMAGFVYNVSLRMTHNTEDAQEVTQEVFLILYRKLKNFRAESSLKTWVYRIAVNYAINFTRKNARARNKMSEYHHSLTGVIVEGEAQKQIEKEHQKQCVDEILSVLNPHQRACMVLRNIEGLSYEQIAETLKITINTVRSRLKRAREKILAQKKQTDYANL